MTWKLFRISKVLYFPEHISMAAFVGRASMRNYLSRLENKLMTMNNRDF